MITVITATNRVVAGAALDAVGAIFADQAIVAILTQERVIPVATVESVVATLTVDAVVPVAGRDAVSVERRTPDHIVPVVPIDSNAGEVWIRRVGHGAEIDDVRL